MKMIIGNADSLFSYPSIEGEVYLNNTQKFSSCHKKLAPCLSQGPLGYVCCGINRVYPENSTKHTGLSSGCGQYSEIVNEQQDSVSVRVSLYAAVT